MCSASTARSCRRPSAAVPARRSWRPWARRARSARSPAPGRRPASSPAWSRACASSRARPFAANLVLSFEPEAQLDALLALAVPVLTFSWGQPGRERIARCHDAGARVAVQVGSAAGARQAVADGADVLIAQGIEAGGHVQSTTPLDELIGLVVDVAGTTPVIATGGLTVRQDITRAHARGAAGTMLGTRFVATAESGCAPGVQGGARGRRGPRDRPHDLLRRELAARAAPRSPQRHARALGGGGLPSAGPASRRALATGRAGGSRDRPLRGRAPARRAIPAPSARCACTRAPDVRGSTMCRPPRSSSSG